MTHLKDNLQDESLIILVIISSSKLLIHTVLAPLLPHEMWCLLPINMYLPCWPVFSHFDVCVCGSSARKSLPFPFLLPKDIKYSLWIQWSTSLWHFHWIPPPTYWGKTGSFLCEFHAHLTVYMNFYFVSITSWRTYIYPSLSSYKTISTRRKGTVYNTYTHKNIQCVPGTALSAKYIFVGETDAFLDLIILDILLGRRIETTWYVCIFPLLSANHSSLLTRPCCLGHNSRQLCAGAEL